MVRSAFRGFVQEVAALGGLILAIVVAMRFYGQAEAYLQAAFGPAPYLAVVGFVALFIATLLVVSLVSGRIAKSIAKGPLGGVDRLLGLIFGSGKAALICILAVYFVSYLAGPSSPLVANSRLVPLAIEGADRIIEQLPEGIKRPVDRGRRTIGEPKPPSPANDQD